MHAFKSEWLKLRRPGMILGGLGAMIGFSILAIVLNLTRLDSATVAGPGGRATAGLTVAQVAASTGFATLTSISATFLGVVALAICAIAVGMEYSNGTLRNLLVRESGRLRLLGGKLLALASFIAVGVVLAYGAALITALILVPTHDISTAAWFTSDGAQSLLQGVGNLLLATLVWGALGAALALILRSTAPALSIGLVYALVVEPVIMLAWSDGAKWLPGQLLSAIAQGGTSLIPYGNAVAFIGAGIVAALVAAGMLFRQRDVAA
jgi:ABC-type transport system involved in multi-copper enzyme maturation permease subunit